MVTENKSGKSVTAHIEGQCPHCDSTMKYASTNHYHCEPCQHTYLEQAYCAICNNQLKIIKGCGAINYLCHTDGLISSKKVQFHYIAKNSD